jgi:hypothetical protein
VGVDFSHCDAGWAYSGFMRFRNKLYNSAGYMGNLSEAYNNGSYMQMKDDDLFPFINHSDCDGHLTPAEMQKIIPRMKAIINNWPDNDYDKQKAILLIEGMELALSKNENLEFM